MKGEIQHISSRCGGGKSYQAIRHAYEVLETSYPDSPTILFASKTNDLNKQNYQEFQNLLNSIDRLARYRIPSIRIDSSEFKGHVTQKVSQTLESGFQGVVFTSHAVLNFIDPELLSGIILIVDEIPQGLIKSLSITYEEGDSGDAWESNIVTKPSSYPGYDIVTLHPNADPKTLRRVIHNIRTARDNTRTKEVADLLEFLLESYDKMYVTTYKQKRSYRCYQAIHWQRLQLIAEHVSQFIILSAQLKHSLFGFVIQRCLKLKIVDRDFCPAINLERKHRNKVNIIPFLKGSKWSSSLKKQPANETLMFDAKLVGMDKNVAEYAQWISISKMNNKRFIMMLNRRDTPTSLLESSINSKKTVVTTTSLHGINTFNGYDHAVYLGSNRPTPFELKHLKMFAQDHGATAQEIEEAIMIERCYENAYQCIARTSIRKQDPDLEKEHFFIVPDEHYVNYLRNWFEAESFDVDDGIIHTLQNEDAKIAKKELVIEILSRYQKGEGKLKDLIEESTLSESVFKRRKKEHYEELQEMGLLKPKRKKS